MLLDCSWSTLWALCHHCCGVHNVAIILDGLSVSSEDYATIKKDENDDAKKMYDLEQRTPLKVSKYAVCVDACLWGVVVLLLLVGSKQLKEPMKKANQDTVFFPARRGHVTQYSVTLTRTLSVWSRKRKPTKRTRLRERAPAYIIALPCRTRSGLLK